MLMIIFSVMSECGCDRCVCLLVVSFCFSCVDDVDCYFIYGVVFLVMVV